MDQRKIILVSPTLSDSSLFCHALAHHLNFLNPGWWNGFNEKYDSYEIITRFGATRGKESKKLYGQWDKESCLQFFDDMKNYDDYVTSIKFDSYYCLETNGLLDNLKEASKDCYHILLFKRDFVDTVLSLCLLNSEEPSVRADGTGLKRRLWHESTDIITVEKLNLIENFYYVFDTYTDFILGNRFNIKFDEIIFSEELRNVKTFKQIMQKTKLGENWNYEGIPEAGPDLSVNYNKQGHISNYYQTVYWIIELLQVNIDSIHDQYPINQPEFENINWGYNIAFKNVSILDFWSKWKEWKTKN